ncbi:membrane-spanning 4-domains subfamily A member 8-like [Antechinus flavipes]|uniref:membrane-spanning 4-domains subfamily A member 8-like n=1 Tax=Antechinus flavipes TaxID=38775 RepID=UPI002235871D|nr:membrane-spanning 4-domains subfamily A member 8-like [Antechinus flavipes]XP_051820985.1 membrane-spanning 4-domains subfamily A member 8-like [Antechinus flavipes]XP_051820986.1 membrane-spanning 4-domains subfamily A member 8-like [Antechinus flavipes]XP_051820988.1 membrane-spanning 4-domains subfamily A member 8-like [Antechinus flavipes]
MNTMTSSNPNRNTVFVVPPPRTVSSVPLPAPPYSNNQPPAHLFNGYQIQMISPYSEGDTIQKIWKESKVLGAIQIIIGLLHIGFGTVLVTTIFRGYEAISFYGGYPYWGGISFIISGTLSVLSQKESATHCIMSGSVGMNIVSAIFSIIGIIVLITELSLYVNYYPIYHPPYYYGVVSSGKGISSTLLLFSILEFVITCVSSHSGCLIVCSQSTRVVGAATVPPGPIVNPAIIPQFASESPLTVASGQP